MQYAAYKGLMTLLVLMLSLFTGCAPMVAGTAGVSGYKAATDERSIGKLIDDSVIAGKIKTKLIGDEFVKARHIDVDVLKGVVYLIGVTESVSQKRMAADIARGVEGVRRVENQLVVGKTSVGQMVDDSVLTSRIKAELIKAENVRSGNVDVDTINNVVTLTGIVRSVNEKTTILNIARRVAGNKTIVDNLQVTP